MSRDMVSGVSRHRLHFWGGLVSRLVMVASSSPGSRPAIGEPRGERSILWSSPIDQRSGRSATCLYISTRSLNSTGTGKARW